MRQASGEVAQLLIRHRIPARAVLGDLAGAIVGVAQTLAFLAHLTGADTHLVGALTHADLGLATGMSGLFERPVTGHGGVGAGAFSLDPGLNGALEGLFAGAFALTAGLLSGAAGVLTRAASLDGVTAGLVDLMTFFGRQVFP